MRATSTVANFENINLKDLRITPASLRLRRVVIGLSVGYIFVFTPVLVYFIWNYMMAEPSVRSQGVESSGVAAKPCANRRLPSLRFALHKGGGHRGAANTSFPPHGPPSIGANPHGGNAGNSTHVGAATYAAVVARQQAGEKGTPGYRMPPQAALIRAKVAATDSGVRADGPPPVRLMRPRQEQQEQPREPSKQPEEARGGQVEPLSTSRRDYPSPPPSGINRLPVRIGFQEMEVGDGLEDESAPSGDRVRGMRRFGAGTDDEESGAAVPDSGGLENGVSNVVLSDVGDDRVGALARDDTDAEQGEEDFQRAVSVRSDPKGKPQTWAHDEPSEQDRRGRAVDFSSDKATLDSLKARLLLHSLSRRQRKGRTGAFYETETSDNLSAYTDSPDLVASGQAGRGNKRVLSAQVRNETEAELRRSEKLRLRKQRKTAEQLKDSVATRVDVNGRGIRNGPNRKASRVDTAFQEDLAQLTSAKKWSRKHAPWRPGNGVRTYVSYDGSVAESEQNSDEQRMIEGMPPSNNKEDNEVISFAEFFKNHLSPKQRNFKIHDALKNVHGRRLMIDYTGKKQREASLVEGFDAGGWPEKPKELSPTKYTLDPFHPYIARRGAGWDFYNPLKPATERNNARELDEQQFYSPEEPSNGVRRHLPRRFWAAPAVTRAPFFRLDETSIAGSPRAESRDEKRFPVNNSLGRARVAGLRSAVSAAIHNAVPTFKAWPEGSIEESPRNNLSLVLLGHYEVTNETVDSASQKRDDWAAKIWRGSHSAQANGGLESFSSVVPIEPESPDASKAKRVSAQNDEEDFSFGNLSRDKAPRYKVSPSDIDTAANHSAKAADKGATLTDAYRRGVDSHPVATRIVVVTNEGHKGLSRIETATSDAALKGNGGSELRTSQVIPINKKPGQASHEEAAWFKRPLNVSAAANEGKSPAFLLRNASGRVPVDSTGAESAGVRALMNVEPIPIERPEFNLSAEVNLANETTRDVTTDSVSFQPKNYEDIVPAEDRNVLSSTLHRELSGNANRFRPEIGTNSSETELPSTRFRETSNSTQNFEPEAMLLTPPKLSLTSIMKGAFTGSRRGVPSPGPSQSGQPSTNVRRFEKDSDFDDFHNAEDTYLRIDVRTVKKLDVPTEPSNVDIGIENKVRKVARSTPSVHADSDEVVRKGVAEIFHPKRTLSENSVTKKEQSSAYTSFKKEHTMLQTRAPLRVPEAANASDTTLETKSRPIHASSQLITESTTSRTDRVVRETVQTGPGGHGSNLWNSSTPADQNLKHESKEEPTSDFINTNAAKETRRPEGIGSRDVSTTVAPKLRREQPASPSHHDTTLEASNSIMIEIRMGKRDSENILDLIKSLRRTRSTVRAVPFVRIAAKNAIDTTSTDHSLASESSKMSLFEEVTTFTPPSQSSETMTQKHTENISPTTRHTARVAPFVRIALKNSSRTTSRHPVTSSAPHERELAEATVFTPPSQNNGTTPKKRDQSSIPSEKQVPGAQSRPASLHNFTAPPVPVTDKKDLFGSMTGTTKGRRYAGETSSALRYFVASNTSGHVNNERSSSSSSSEPVGLHLNKRIHHEDGKAPALKTTTLIQPKTSARKLSSATHVSQTRGKLSSRTQPDWKASTVITADKRRFIKDVSTPNKRPMETERTSKMIIRTGISLSTTSEGTKAPTESKSGAAKHTKRSGRGGVETLSTFATSERGTQTNYTAAATGHSSLSSSSNTVQKGRNLVTLGYATKPPKTAFPTAESSEMERSTATSTFRAPQENKTNTFVSQRAIPSRAASPDRSPLARSVSTPSTALPTSTETKELGFGDDMLGRLGDVNRVPNSTLGAGKAKGRPTRATSAAFKNPVLTGTVGKPLIEIVPLTTQRRRAAYDYPKSAGPEEATTSTSEPTVVVFDIDDDEENEARLHFPMMKIRRRPTFTPRRPAIMDLFGRGLLSSRRTTTRRPILQHHIAVRRGRPERDPTLRPRLQPDVALRRRHHRSHPPRPYRLTLFHDEPLHAVRVPVKRMG